MSNIVTTKALAPTRKYVIRTTLRSDTLFLSHDQLLHRAVSGDDGGLCVGIEETLWLAFHNHVVFLERNLVKVQVAGHRHRGGSESAEALLGGALCGKPSGPLLLTLAPVLPLVLA